MRVGRRPVVRGAARCVFPVARQRRRRSKTLATRLPYRATTATGDVFDIAFPLHPSTGSPMRVGQILSAVLAAVDADVRLDPATSNGDVLQALAMALAVRAAMINAPKPLTDRLAADLVAAALAALDAAERRGDPRTGHA
jgi:hypothetical protein